jgi:hypothetical protein
MAEKAKTIASARRWTAPPSSARRQQRAIRPRAFLSRDWQVRSQSSPRRRPSAAFDKGYYIEPTIFYDVDNSARIAREEIFGPVAAVIPFERRGRRHSASPTTRPTASPPPSGRAISTRPSAWSSNCAPASSGSTTCSPPASKRPGAATSNPARPRARPLGHRRVSRNQAGPHQSERKTHRLVLNSFNILRIFQGGFRMKPWLFYSLMTLLCWGLWGVFSKLASATRARARRCSSRPSASSPFASWCSSSSSFRFRKRRRLLVVRQLRASSTSSAFWPSLPQ